VRNAGQDENAFHPTPLPTPEGTKMDSLLPVFAIAGLAVFAGLALWWQFSRSRSLLEQWAERNGYHILSRRYRSFFKGPFFWTSSRGQAVYHVTVEEKEGGRRRSGWVRCGGWFLGLLSDNVEVQWDD
jgi:hypothetical protein